MFVTALWLQCPGVREREAVLFVAVCLMKVSVEQYGDQEGRAEQIKFVCVIQHRALEGLCLSEDTPRRILPRG